MTQRNGIRGVLVLAVLATWALPPVRASDLDEFKVKRRQVFEFTRKPRVTRTGDKVTIAFTSRAFCDATVAIENADGRIVRHLASGVLGPNAPAPFRKNSTEQTLVWDSKDDQGVYVDDADQVAVRVSLGLKPRFERNLVWWVRKRFSFGVPIMRATGDGVYVFQAGGVDHLRLFDHKGDYVRTVYPFPAHKLKSVRGLKWVEFPQGYRLPFKNSGYQQTLLTSGTSFFDGMSGRAATAMAVQGSKIALVELKLNRLSTDGSTGGLALEGPATAYKFRAMGMNADGKVRQVGPSSAAFSPDGKWVYLTGFAWRVTWDFDVLHGVIRIPYKGDGGSKAAGAVSGRKLLRRSTASDGGATLFAGSMKQRERGKANGQFDGATSVACDKRGRVYVSDFMNDRVQVFSPDGRHLKNIKTSKPTQVEVHPRTQEIYVFSWPMSTRSLAQAGTPYRSAMTVYGPLDNPRQIAAYPLPLPACRGRFSPWWNLPPVAFRAALDGWTDPPTIWLARGRMGNEAPPWNEFNIRLLQPRGGTLRVIREFGRDVARAAGRRKYPIWNVQHQRLYVNPVTGILYLGEPDSPVANKSFKQVVMYDPNTGQISVIELPFGAEDMAFDLNGLVYLRTTSVVGRFNAETWREVPWDYGEQLDGVGLGRAVNLVAGLRIPSQSPVCFHQGGIAVSARGHLAVSCALRRRAKARSHDKTVVRQGQPYTPTIYPGRVLSSTSACLHVWDKHGKVLYQDAIPGMPQIDGVGIDKDDNLYIMATPTRILDGKRYFNKATETLMKFRPRRTPDPRELAFVSGSGRAAVRLAKADRPGRPPEVDGSFTLGRTWVNGAEWFYGGVGFAGFNAAGCACWHARFALDYFGRSFAPEMDQYRVAVLDTNGNLILRVGQYGNADDGVPLVAPAGSPRARSIGGDGGSKATGAVSGRKLLRRPIGGDEVGLFHACYVATHTDRRLFIVDIGNARIISVKLDYHTTEKVALRDVPDERQR